MTEGQGREKGQEHRDTETDRERERGNEGQRDRKVRKTEIRKLTERDREGQ